MNPLKRPALAIIVLLLLSCSLAVAEADPPGRVARLSYINGSVSVQPNGTDDWVQAVLNRPLTTSDNVWTDKDSRAELSVGTAVMRMGAETSLTLTNVSNETVQVQLHQGTLNLRVRQLHDGEIYEVDSPNVAFTAQKGGEYRFDVHPDKDESIVTVWKGEGDATGNGPAIRVHAKQQVQFYGTSLAHNIHETPHPDGFDDWCRVRDERQDNSYSARYVAPGVVGYEDLDYYGTWRDIPPYGPIWVPAVAAGWAPYRFGHWIWVGPWGWTWVDDAPWGFAPFHYGRWVYHTGFWGWAPGPIFVRPVYAPALVAFFGGPSFAFGVSFGFGGGIGWVPLGFREPFFPFYHVSPFYFHHVNAHINNINIISNHFFHDRDHFVPRYRFANARVDGAFTAVPRHVFENSRPVGREALHVPAAGLRNAGAISHVPAEPTRHSMLGGEGGRHAFTPPARAFDRPVVSRAEPPSRPARSMQAHVDSPARGDHGFAGRPSEDRQGPSAQMHGQHSVPRPPDRGGDARADNGSGRPAAGNRGDVATEARNHGMGDRGPQGDSRRSVPRPPQDRSIGSGGRDNERMSAGPRDVPHQNNGNSEHNFGRGPAERQAQPGSPRENNFRPQGGDNSPRSRSSVPRPTGRVMPASEYYRNHGYSSDRSAGWSGAQRGYGSDRSSAWSGGSRGGYSHDAPSTSRGGRGYYGGSSGYGGHSAAPQNYGRSGGNSTPSYRAPSHQGGGSSSGGGNRGSGRSSGHSRGGGVA
jgi:hypothetical protein